MHSAMELRANEYTVFFNVSVGRILLLSPSTAGVEISLKQNLQSPFAKIVPVRMSLHSHNADS
jgi:hypothetical protein